jgi:hypothetical protein
MFRQVIVIFATLGLASAGQGFVADNQISSMSAIHWIQFWRFIMGIGIGM